MTATLSRDDLMAALPDLTDAFLDTCLDQGWIVPSRTEDGDVFLAIDAARARLILELRRDFGVNDEAMGLVLGLLDQVHDLRRQIQRLSSETQPGPKRPKRQIPIKRVPTEKPGL